MAVTVVTYAVDDPGGVAVPNARVVVRLVGVGDRVDEPGVVVGERVVVTDAQGAFSVGLVPNSLFRVAGSYYTVVIEGGPAYAIVVPVSGVSVSLWGLRVDPETVVAVPAPAPAPYVLRTELGAANGAATLGPDQKVPAGQLPVSGGGIPASVVDAAGDVLVGSGPDSVTRLPVGADRRVLMVDGSQPLGVRWADQFCDPVARRFGYVSMLARPEQDAAGLTSTVLPAGRLQTWLFPCAVGQRISRIGMLLEDVGVGPGSLWGAVHQADNTLLGVSGDEAALFSGGAIRVLRDLPVPVGVATGSFVRVSLLSTMATGPNVAFAPLGNAAESWLNPPGRLCAVRSNPGDFAAIPADLTAFLAVAIPWVDLIVAIGE